MTELLVALTVALSLIGVGSHALLSSQKVEHATSTLAVPAAREPDATFGGVSLRLDYATTSAAQEKGLGGRPSLPNDYGMLFVFQNDDRYGFWMKDTLVPLDMFWLDDKRQVVSIARDVATSTFPTVFYPSKPARYVLETVAGFATAHQITLGTELKLKDLRDVLQ